MGGCTAISARTSREPPCSAANQSTERRLSNSGPRRAKFARVEIERKFLVRELPDLDGADSEEVAQGYLSLGGDGEVRLRRKGERLLLTVKRGEGLAREEVEVPLPAESFEALWPLTEGRRLRKRRHRLPAGELTIELDVYEGALEGLAVAEVEFPGTDAARVFEPPAWLGEEVTGDERYLNETLAVRGRPL